MKKVLPLFLLIIVGLYSATQGAIEVNRVRGKIGMVKLKYNSILAKAAHNHAKYLARLRLASHLENPRYRYFTGRTPFDRIANVGYPSRVGVENISFAERSYRKSVEVLLSTLYHRLAFLDFRIDSIGTSAYGNIRGRVYVYDMASSKVAKLCRELKSGRFGVKSGRFLVGVCADKNIKVPQNLMRKALFYVERRNPKIVLYPYPNAKNIPTKFVNESPNPFRGVVNKGFPITIQFNPSRYRFVKIKKFNLFDSSNRRVKAKIITAKSDIRRKLSNLTFALIPNRPLKRKKSYRVEFVAVTDRGRVKKSWRFSTK